MTLTRHRKMYHNLFHGQCLKKKGEMYYTGNFVAPPKPNLKVAIGEDAWTYFQYYCKKPPNRFQRWMTRKLLGIKVEILK